MNLRKFTAAIVFVLIPTLASAQPSPGNCLAYLDEVDPYYPHAKFPKLITPQWVGEPGVEAVVILAIDDMRDPKRYEAFLRPLLRRLKEIDGRAPVSIMTNQVDPKDPQLQVWLKEGLSLECHTVDHPCPFFKDGFAKAKETYEKCVDLMSAIPNNNPVAFRMPCCDSLNTPSPRFYAEIFNKTTDRRKFLSIDSSVFNVFTDGDPGLPRNLVQMPDGTERFRKYLPKDRAFVNTIENYPYPYVIGRLCWQFPCMTPSDWQAQNLHKPNNPQTVKDWQAALDCTVIKKGVMTMVFHPHGWIKSDQLVELVDYADKKYGKKAKFLNFREALERLNNEMLLGQGLRHSKNGGDNGVRLVDVDDDGVMDVIIANDSVQKIRAFTGKIWGEFELYPDQKLVSSDRGIQKEQGYCFAILRPGVSVSVLGRNYGSGNWHHLTSDYRHPPQGLPEFNPDSWGHWREYFIWDDPPVLGSKAAVFRDISGRGFCDLIAWQKERHVIYSWSDAKKVWAEQAFSLPLGARLVNDSGNDAGLRFLDLDGDGKLDIIFSNEKEYGVYLFKDMKEGWSRKVIAGKAGEAGALPMIANKGENMGFFVHSGQLWWSNENTALLKDHVARVSIKELLKGQGRLP